MYFRVSKYTNIDTRYTMISCIVYKDLIYCSTQLNKMGRDGSRKAALELPRKK